MKDRREYYKNYYRDHKDHWAKIKADRQGIDYDTASIRIYSHADTCPGKPDCVHEEESMNEATEWVIANDNFLNPDIYYIRSGADEIAVCYGKETKSHAEMIVQAVNTYSQSQALIAALAKALESLVADVQQYEAWQRPCLALDRAKDVLAQAKDHR